MHQGGWAHVWLVARDVVVKRIHTEENLAPRAACVRRDKRQRSAEEKKTKLKSPNFVISPTRLSFRNVPFSMTEAQLRALAVRAVKERASREKPEVVQVRDGSRPPARRRQDALPSAGCRSCSCGRWR